ncbi:MAG: N(6)-L-threonylcarbamoyladenine synthase Kae1 [Thaumarchaeota archaeon]|nr:N(6)-L-threonylcarbamoyladenine synthase Kae1 [Nitrososphaerota archaeon]
MLCLGIESTAHTFGVSVVSSDGKVLSDVKDAYKAPPGSGIHPREASRHHSEVAPKLVQDALDIAKTKFDELDAVAYSAGPGLGPCLRVGATVARALASYYRKPLVPANHAIGHIELGCLLSGAKDPVVLLVSGGHTMIVACHSKRWRVFGETLDITVGQLIDQFGREAGMSSPAGPQIENLAKVSNEYTYLPYSVKGNDVSLSGVITSVKKMMHDGNNVSKLSFSLQETAFAMLTEVTERALAFSEKKEVLITGGVAANSRLKEMLNIMCREHDARLYEIPREKSGDCGLQIAWTGILAYQAGVQVPIEEGFVKQSWRLDRVDAPWRN